MDEAAPFSIGERIRLKNESKIGIVTEMLPGKQYRIFISDTEQPIVAENDLEPIAPLSKFVTATEFLRDLLLFKLRRPLSDTLYSYSASRTNFEAYQFKPAIKFLGHPSNRILIADEVGLGKTIEACIIYFELKARMKGDLRRTLVVCPAGLTQKWQNELRYRFREDFEILTGERINRFFADCEKFGPATYLKGICSLERLRSQDLAGRISEMGVPFDLVIVDEAHHMKNPATISYDLGEMLTAHADAMILLTATPVQLGSEDLFYLLNILEPGEFQSVELFDYQLEPNRFTNRAISCLSRTPPEPREALNCLSHVSKNFKENPYYQNACSTINQLDSVIDKSTEHECIVSAINDLQKTNSFAYIFNRTRRKEVAAGAVRVANVVSVQLTSVEREIYQMALEYARRRASLISGSVSILGLIQVERQLASSIGAFKALVERYRSGIIETLELEASETELDYPTQIALSDIDQLVRELARLYDELGDTDSKFDQFHVELGRILDANPKSKVIVYSFFKATLRYLKRRLNELQFDVDLITGDVSISRREEIIEEFSKDPKRRVLLSSEVGSEGLDFQFCDTVINYDLPWNPMRVEQRIGRVDRYGQTSPKVTVCSFFLANTIEERILRRLYERIGVFEASIGDLEPILGDIVRELQITMVAKRLTPEEEVRRTEALLLTLEHRRRQLEEFENHRYELMGQDLLFSQEVDESLTSGRYVSPRELSAMVQTYVDQL